jgi:protein-S-isoprenylcysteine O-methyltransferase Ste14
VSLWRHLAAVLLLPGVVTIGVPGVIVWQTDAGLRPPAVVGIPLITAGVLLVISTVALFVTVGRGTLAPWDPTTRLVVEGPYRYVRNPMISGVLFTLLGEAACFASFPLLTWFAAVLGVNAVYFPLVEERGLRRRFGAEYDEYAANVPRWIPRLRPWTDEEVGR